MGKLLNLGGEENDTAEDGQESLEENTVGKYEGLGKKIGSLVDSKNAAYGNSFDQAGDFLKLLYPNGIRPEQYGDMLCVVRIFDKLKRIATQKNAFSESPYQDIVGYGLLGTERDMRVQKNTPPDPEIAIDQQEASSSSDINKDSEMSVAETVQEPVAPSEHAAGEVAVGRTAEGVLTPAEAAATPEKDLRPVYCTLCGGFVTSVVASLANNRFVHEHCFYRSQNPQTKTIIPVADMLTKTTSP